MYIQLIRKGGGEGKDNFLKRIFEGEISCTTKLAPDGRAPNG